MAYTMITLRRFYDDRFFVDELCPSFKSNRGHLKWIVFFVQMSFNGSMVIQSVIVAETISSRLKEVLKLKLPAPAVAAIFC